ncbi:TolC family protein [Vibrio sp. 1751]|uniref:TolC family protein n=3 Tax=Vibrionaceae TaxID=641 RepID=UPI00296412DB|nr:TolC family protein [Vibrio sp. 1751]MDW2100045.1 TolC family protein [Vibrio sp. 1751]
MRWFVLLAVLAGIFWTANWSYHQMDQAVLITDYWQAQENLEQWGLVNFEGNEPKIYAFNSTKGYWNIFKGLWPIWTLFILSFFVLVPLSIYIFNGLNNAQIAAAKEAQLDAEERVNSAYQEQLSRVKKELEGEWDSFHKQKNQVLERESAIQNREHTAQQIEKSAKERVDNIVEQYNQEKDRFEAEMLDMARARDNAQAGYKRIKMKLDRKKNLSF